MATIHGRDSKFFLLAASLIRISVLLIRSTACWLLLWCRMRVRLQRTQAHTSFFVRSNPKQLRVSARFILFDLAKFVLCLSFVLQPSFFSSRVALCFGWHASALLYKCKSLCSFHFLFSPFWFGRLFSMLLFFDRKHSIRRSTFFACLRYTCLRRFLALGTEQSDG